jgi:hypothetical protein
MQQYSYDEHFMFAPRRAQWTAGLAAVASLMSGCSGADVATPVAKFSLAANKSTVAIGSPIELTYRFEVAPGTKPIDGDYRVFVHVNRDDGTTIWNDDHDLPPGESTTKWQPGQVIQYSRTRFIPVVSYVGEATIEAGLYRDDVRLPLATREQTEPEIKARSYKVGKVELLPRSENIQVIRLSGWHAVEYAADDATVDWQWTQKSATLSLRNPRRDLVLYLECDARSDLFPDKPQQVTIYAGDSAVATFTADRPGIILRKIPVTTAQLGTGDMAELRIEVDRTFLPSKLPGGGRDPRELGIRVYHAFVEGAKSPSGE